MIYCIFFLCVVRSPTVLDCVHVLMFRNYYINMVFYSISWWRCDTPELTDILTKENIQIMKYI